MRNYYYDKNDVAEFVRDRLTGSVPGSVLTMTITPGQSAGFYVHIVTDESSEDIELQTAKFFSETQVNT